MPILKIKYLAPDLKPINYSNKGDAGLDLRASGRWVINLGQDKKEITQDSYTINPNERILIQTGIEVELPKGHWGNIRDRSGLAMKQGLHTLAGVLDETYRGEIGIIMINLSNIPHEIKKNDRIAQMIITPYSQADVAKEENLSDTTRGKDGLGSSGKE